MTRPYQNGYLFKRAGSWRVRYREQVRSENGTLETVQRSQRIASVKDYPRKSEVMPLKNDFMARLNRIGFAPEASVTLRDFTENLYFPAATNWLEESTLSSYKDVWYRHLEPHAGSMRVRDFRTVDGENIVRSIEREHGTKLAHSTYARIKTVLSAIFTHAKRVGIYDGANPVQGVSTPRGRTHGRQTNAYSLETIQRILALLPDRGKVAVGIAAFAALREGEIRGLGWEDYDAGELRVRRTVWRDRVKAKTKTGEDDVRPGIVPVIPTLQKLLDDWRPKDKYPVMGYILAEDDGSPINLHNYGFRVIKPVLEAAGIPWWGWHAFRRGLATNLNSLGVDDTTIQAILRHQNVSTTQKSYIKPVRKDVTAAMERLEQQWQQGRTIN